MRLIIATLSLFITLSCHADLPLTVERHTPPPFGFGVGSLIREQIDIHVMAPWQLDFNRLPGPGPVNDWLEIRSLRHATDSDSDGQWYRIEIEYQIFPVLKRPQSLEIPSLTLDFTAPDSSQHQHYRLPPWEFTATPFIMATAADTTHAIRPLWQPDTTPLTPYRLRLGAITGGLLSLVLILGWQRRWYPWQRAAFSRALPTIRRASRNRQPLVAYRAFHQAINETAGHAVFGESLGRFIAHHPPFISVRKELQTFFAHSQQLFFNDPDDVPLEELVSLCEICIRLEKQCRK